MSERFDIGDKVTFNARGRDITGTVTDIKLSRPGSRNRLVRAYGLPTPGVTKLVVLPDGEKGLWTVPDRMCKKVGRATDPNVARQQASTLINQIADQRFQRASQGRDKADSAGLYGLKKGDAIEVQARHRGWIDAVFTHITANGRVGFRVGDFDDKIHFSPPQFVRKKQAAG